MIIARIKGANRECGKEQGYMGLPIRDMVIIDKATGYYSPAMETAWTPTPDELDRLNKGANVISRIMGEVPPPMLLTVDTELPEPVRDEERETLVAHLHTYVDPDNLVHLTEKQRDMILKALDR